ncbi:hypothetical protein [Fodinicola acaciae]|uniref:hypothetical protein n=1 Tax=Fodinicola acaciae TaxID=2681555 RepID=UPI0013D67BD7|nr:hypothetical protein [Fodinicola acaciae]
MRKTSIAATIAAAAAIVLLGSGPAAAASGTFSGYGSDSQQSTAESYAVNNAYFNAQLGGFQTGDCGSASVSSTQTSQEWQATAYVSCYRADS